MKRNDRDVVNQVGQPEIRGVDQPSIFADNVGVNMRGNLTRLMFIEGQDVRVAIVMETGAAIMMANGIINTRNEFLKAAMAETAAKAPEGAIMPIPPRAN